MSRGAGLSDGSTFDRCRKLGSHQTAQGKIKNYFIEKSELKLNVWVELNIVTVVNNMDILQQLC